MTQPTNEEIAEALRSIEGLPIGTRLVVLLAADRLSPQVTDSDGWIAWGGGEMPVKRGTPVKVRHRDGDEFTCTAGVGYSSRWDHRGNRGDVVAYRTVK